MSKRTRPNFIRRNIDKIYNIGAAIVILGALFKIEHISFGPINGGLMLTIGLVSEAIVFTLSAFEKNDDSAGVAIQVEDLSNSDVPQNNSGNFSGNFNNYGEQMTSVISNLNKLNAEAEKHLKISLDNALVSADTVTESKEMQEHIRTLNSNLKALNQVYSGMLLAMEKK